MISELTGLGLGTCENGAEYARIHYTADPTKRDRVWIESERKAQGTRFWDQQMEMSEDVYEGEPVYADYVDSIHCPDAIRNGFIPLVPRSLYYMGWDCGQTLSPAAVLFQVTPMPYQVHALMEVVPDGPEPMETFAPIVIGQLQKVYPQIWDMIRHVGDATVTQRSGGSGESAQQVARRVAGIVIEPMSNALQGRISAVSRLLTDRIAEETPRFYVSGKGCPTLRRGFLGAYKLEESPRGDMIGAGRILLMPLKNSYSHVHDACQYGAVKIWKFIDGSGGQVAHRKRKPA